MEKRDRDPHFARAEVEDASSRASLGEGAASDDPSSEASPHSYLADPFDNPNMGKRVGAHRAAPRRAARWIYFLWAAIAVVVLTVVGIIFLVIGPGNVSLPRTSGPAAVSTASPEPSVQARTEESTTIAILDGSGNSALVSQVSSFIATNKLGTVVFEGQSAENDIAQSAIFYSSERDEGLAKGLADELGGLQYYLSEEEESLDTQLVVRLGTQFELP
ncbi:LytR C-terminal domain-containing protein [Lysinibacter sp. HNR]|uniref:LytR C-terminal domain-containing protein n=1 Tax=Lysinibacter sp. HNR TaxID=3031408 RepID=UPI0024356C98|nr:LytR C-terminal domain-containing protein [Lysinibacter sp. HNR]WGD36996.1 LytR C-terminal domain-containing protein [Lysinibacter sp. HNR]